MYLYWQISDEKPDLGSYGDSGVDGLGDLRSVRLSEERAVDGG